MSGHKRALLKGTAINGYSGPRVGDKVTETIIVELISVRSRGPVIG